MCFHVLWGDLDEVSAYAHPTQLFFSTVKKFMCVGGPPNFENHCMRNTPLFVLKINIIKCEHFRFDSEERGITDTILDYNKGIN